MKYPITAFAIHVFAAVSLSAQTVVTLPDNRLALSLETEVGKFYSIRQSQNLEGITDGPVLTTAEGTGVTLGPILPLDPEVVPQAFYHIATETLTARPTADANLFANSTLLGINLLPNSRWDFFGITGNFSYQVTTAQEATLILTLDDFGNDPAQGVISADLDFGSDGDLTTVVADFDYFSDGEVSRDQETQTLDLTQDSLAPGVLLFDLLAGGPYLDYDFVSRDRFVFGGRDSGDYFVTRPNDDEVIITCTYDRRWE